MTKPPLIISLRGANGSGKSTIVRAIMAQASHRQEQRIPQRQKPIGYWCEFACRADLPDTRPHALYVPGHYEIANGGVDTLRYLDDAYAAIRRAHAGMPGGVALSDQQELRSILDGNSGVTVPNPPGFVTADSLDAEAQWGYNPADVLYEGKNMSDGTSRIMHFPQSVVKIIVINHPVDACVESVRARGHNIEESRIKKLHAKVLRDAEALAYRDYDVSICDRRSALKYVRKLLELPTPESETQDLGASPAPEINVDHDEQREQLAGDLECEGDS